MEWYKLTKEELFKKLNTSASGLSNKQANDLLKKNGLNLLPKKKKDSILKIFLQELTAPITLLLIVAIIASILVGEYTDAIAITFIVLVDLIIGCYEENKANTTADALTNLVRVYTKVIREGKETIVDSSNLVVGDIVLLESGDKVPADIRLIEDNNLSIDESTLTGESVSVTKDSTRINKDDITINEQKNMLFASTNVVTGRGVGVVVRTSLETEIGKIFDTISKTKEEKSPLTIRVEKFSKQISILVILVAIIITVLLYMKGVETKEIFLSVIALSVSAMPEGLPLALTMALTIASNKMAKKGVIAKKLYSIESLGSCTVIASDKTGTLTINKQTLKKVVTPYKTSCTINDFKEYKDHKMKYGETEITDLAFLGSINNEAKLIDNKFMGDSIDVAFMEFGDKCNIDMEKAHIITQVPYESANQYSAVFFKLNNKTYCTVKGSFEKVYSFCSKIENEAELEKEGLIPKEKIAKDNSDLAKDGYRVIAIACGEVEEKSSYKEEDIKDLVFRGIVGFIDPIRKEVVKSINDCRKASIKVLMITGDHPLTAFAISKELKLIDDNYEKVTTGSEVEEYFNKGEKVFDEFVKSKVVFSRVTPIQKLNIVESLKRQGEFVAVTGDGVNDAPALHTANIGVAMGSGTDVARETSKMIVMDDNFTSIVESIREGRIAYSNIRKITYFLISCGLAEIIFFLLSIILDTPTPLVAIQLLWLNVVTDGIQDISLSLEKGEVNIMDESPRDPKESLFDKVLFEEIIVSGVFIGLLVFSFFYVLVKIMKVDISIARGYVMALMVFIQNIHVFNCRSEKKSAFTIPLKRNKAIFIGVAGSILLQVLVMEVPLLSKLLQTTSIPVIHMILLFVLAYSILIVMEVYKKIKFAKEK